MLTLEELTDTTCITGHKCLRMGFFKSRVSWSSTKGRKVLRKNREEAAASEDSRVNSTHDGDSSAAEMIDTKRSASLPFLGQHLQNTPDRRATVAETLPSHDADDYTTERSSSPTLIDEHYTNEGTQQVVRPKKKRDPGPPLFPDVPSNYSKPISDSTADRMISDLPADLWGRIADYLNPADAAHLAHASKTLRYRLGSTPWKALDLIENHKHKIAFLSSMDHKLPDHIFCSLCASYHLRVSPGNERLQAHYISNPISICPNARLMALPRIRLTHGRELAFAYVQLTTRALRHGTSHGVPAASLTKRWNCADSDWSHSVRFHIHENGHLLMRCASTAFVKPRLQPNEERLLLYSRSDYAPYFSVCTHWASGNLLPLCKCALSHIPQPVEGVVEQLKKGPKVQLSKMHTNFLPKMCDECKPLRRCRECPTEYMITLKLVEDRKDSFKPFKQAICLTRWSDLGPGIAPTDSEWAAVNGVAEYDSWAAVTNASLCSIFEAAVSRGAPGGAMKWLDIHRDTHQDVY